MNLKEAMKNIYEIINQLLLKFISLDEFGFDVLNELIHFKIVK
jgi:hypothetical protein